MGLATTREKFLNPNMQDYQYFNTDSFEITVFSAMGQRKGKKKNEDSCGILLQSRDNVIMVVADGMGGHKMGDKASRIAVTSVLGRSLLRKRLFKASDITQRIEKAHNKIKELGVEAGSTIVCCHVHGETLRFFCVGDSVGFHLSAEEGLGYKTIEHSVVGYATESGIISESEASDRPDANIILNCLGFDDSRLESSFDMPLKKGDKLFLCTDGVTDLLDSKTIIQTLKKSGIEEATKNLVSQLLERRSTEQVFDDHSFIFAQKVN